MSRHTKLQAAMLSLCANPAFAEFMDEVKEMKEQAVRDSINDQVVGDSAKMLAAAGEIRAYYSLLDMYQNFVDQPQQIVVDGQIQE